MKLILILLVITGCLGNSYEPAYKMTKISSLAGETIYLKSKNWGITYDHQVSVISKSSNKKWEPDSTKEFVFKGLEPFFYEFRNDSLFVFCKNVSDIPAGFISNIKIVQKELSNPEYIHLIEQNSSLQTLKKM